MIDKFLLLCVVLLCVVVRPVLASDGQWVLVDSRAQTLTVKQGDKTVLVIENVAIGRQGAGRKQHRGDDVTPKGHYQIAWFNDQSPYHRFLGLSYPSRLDAVNGYKQGIIDKKTMRAIIDAHDKGLIPPQNTALGGQIGIHGLGSGSAKVHRAFNWTHGCIAVTNEEIDRLRALLKKDTPVVVR
ncbi:MAG: L,D-transpeptidase [Methylococcales bacterium]|nr:L,D-transpeptidase [Methylococcales bacterium]